MAASVRSMNGSAVFIIGIVVTAIASLVSFIAIEVLRPGMDNALLYGQVFLFAGTIITGLFGAMKSTQAVAKVDVLHEKVDVIEHKVDGINAAALANQAIVSEAKGEAKGDAAGFERGVTTTAGGVAVATGGSVPVVEAPVTVVSPKHKEKK